MWLKCPNAFWATLWTYGFTWSVLFFVRISTNTQIATGCVLKCLLVLAWVIIYTQLAWPQETELSSIQTFWTCTIARIGGSWLVPEHYISSDIMSCQWSLCVLRNIKNRDGWYHLFTFRFKVLFNIQYG